MVLLGESNVLPYAGTTFLSEWGHFSLRVVQQYARKGRVNVTERRRKVGGTCRFPSDLKIPQEGKPVQIRRSGSAYHNGEKES